MKIEGYAGRVFVRTNQNGQRMDLNFTPDQARELARELDQNADAAEQQQRLIDQRRS